MGTKQETDTSPDGKPETSLETSLDGFSDGKEHMMQKAALELPGEVIGRHYPGVPSTFPSAGLSYKFDSLQEENAAVSETVNPTAGELFGARVCGKRIRRSEPRVPLNAPLWLTSLQKPGVFEVVPTENVSTAGVQMVTQKFWDHAEMVLVSSPPGFCLQGSVVYCNKLASDDYVLGIRLNAPVEDWIETLGLDDSSRLPFSNSSVRSLHISDNCFAKMKADAPCQNSARVTPAP